ncbi:hypothetical protein M427DRAFT_395767 [Gonapodya prolifera JEL478]|uniref:Uncharacterized protein n=1 Tax=Gonapodya prolifera (strain JEL478) TaxID=1344416 RepID=A0A139A6W3_GONPJ|nr:hypothetical protein M427DRAFT_395767 [Gonapodya prolifera JEL478]|eukprot:KXS12557.1 hypothetical protein M427DRAFT_395767 [Gonapodya prolifera JEL478]
MTIAIQGTTFQTRWGNFHSIPAAALPKKPSNRPIGRPTRASAGLEAKTARKMVTEKLQAVLRHPRTVARFSTDAEKIIWASLRSLEHVDEDGNVNESESTFPPDPAAELRRLYEERKALQVCKSVVTGRSRGVKPGYVNRINLQPLGNNSRSWKIDVHYLKTP